MSKEIKFNRQPHLRAGNEKYAQDDVNKNLTYFFTIIIKNKKIFFFFRNNDVNNEK
jgi:hypothetical protein